MGNRIAVYINVLIFGLAALVLAAMLVDIYEINDKAQRSPAIHQLKDAPMLKQPVRDHNSYVE